MYHINEYRVTANVLYKNYNIISESEQKYDIYIIIYMYMKRADSV